MNFEIVLATTNQHKLQEFRKILSPHGILVYGLNDLNFKVPEVEENGETYLDNALIKAKSVLPFTTFPIIADDTGLEIKAMNNEPGLKTARFAQELGGYENAFNKIFNELEGKERDARFYCGIVILNIEEKPLKFEGIMEGKIASEIRGKAGFGYDPIFIPQGFDKCYAEMSEEEKNTISHRAKALLKFLTYLRLTGRINK